VPRLSAACLRRRYLTAAPARGVPAGLPAVTYLPALFLLPLAVLFTCRLRCLLPRLPRRG